MVKETFDFAFIMKILPKVLKALPVTLYITVWSAIFGWLFGLIFTCGKVSRYKRLGSVINVLTAVIRGIPTVVLLYLVYFGLPNLLKGLVGIDISQWQKTTFVIIAMALELSMSSSEMFRSAYNSLDKGQLEAAHALGMTKWQRFVRIIFPQGLYVILPNLTSATMTLIQGTSLVYTLGVMDIMGKARQLNTNEMGLKSLESYVTVALVYWAFSIIVIQIFKGLERRFGRGMKTAATSGNS
ncbi:MAG: amino acid ABC transporter permease [Candidatus Choladocola sp.]|nr:amino acid ABC transporter permease [Candidatus Choladocola sp.]